MKAIRSVKIILVCNTNFSEKCLKMVRNLSVFHKEVSIFLTRSKLIFTLASIKIDSSVISLPPIDLRKLDSLDYIPL